MGARRAFPTNEHHPGPQLGRRVCWLRLSEHLPCMKAWNSHRWYLHSLQTISLLGISLRTSQTTLLHVWTYHPKIFFFLILRTSVSQVIFFKLGLRCIWRKGHRLHCSLDGQGCTVYNGFPIESSLGWFPGCKVTSVQMLGQMRGLESHNLSTFLFQRGRRV